MLDKVTGAGRPAAQPSSRPAGGEAPHALVYHAGGLGDFVLSLPALLRLQQAHPDLTWHLWGPRERLSLLPGWQPAPALLLREAHSLWSSSPGAALQAELRSFHSPWVFGAAPQPWMALPGLDVGQVRTFPTSGNPWVPAFQAAQLDRAGVPRPARPWLPRWRREVLGRRQPRRLVLHPGSGDVRKNLPLVTWESVLRKLAEATGLAPLVIGGEIEAERGGWSLEAVERRVCRSLEELLQVLSETALFLGNDGGPAHLAGALGIPTVAVFGPSDPSIWRPLGRRVAVVAADCACAPCCRRPPVACEQQDCLEALPAERVVERALALLPGLGQERAFS